jgi:Rad3-related DNA helicase/DNA polymerase III epsilon subunit-like protein
MSRAAPDVVVLDTETTGLDPFRDRVIDIGAVRLDGDLHVVDRYSTLIALEAPLPLFVQRLTGLCDADFEAAPTFTEAHERLRSFIGAAVVAGHNAPFDKAHLDEGARRHGLVPLEAEWLDTLDASLLLLPELDRHALGLLADQLELPTPSHRALADAEATAALLARLCSRAAGLAIEERTLLTTARWGPLRVLDGFSLAPDEAPPPLVAEPSPPGGDRLTVLPCEADDWLVEFDDGSASEADERPSGLAARLPGFRRRPGQLELAEAVAGLFDRGGIALYEAGTGMGKSLAYLVPAAFHSAATGERVVVSTKTKALQRQLASHELPLVAAGLPAGWRWATLMGRENYLCRRRLDEAIADAGGALPDGDRLLALAYLVGRARRGEVDLSSLPYRAGRQLTALASLAYELRSSRATCLGRRCPARRHCHWRVARSRAEAAHLVCVNHALLLTGADTLPAFSDVVIDEAHLLHSEAVSVYGSVVDAAALQGLAAELRGRGRQRSLAARLRAAARRAEPGDGRALAASADVVEATLERLSSLSTDLGASLIALAAVAGDQTDGPRTARQQSYAPAVWLTPGLREQPAWEAFAVAAETLSGALGELAAALRAAAEALDPEHPDAPTVTAALEAAATAADLLGSASDVGDASQVVWAQLDEQAPRGRRSRLDWTITRTPLDPGDRLRSELWERVRSAVLTSATLSVAGSFAYLRGVLGLGAESDVESRIFSSPFDYERQAVLVLEHEAGRYDREELPERQADRLCRLAAVTGGRTLALFTNRREMERVAAEVGPYVEDDGVLVLAQGLHGSASALAEEFRAHPGTVLLGLDTLWTGQDFPGETLVCLVIAKIPFPRQDPFFQARRRHCETAGRDWFRDFYLPEAVLKFRQGFGRLIRTETDVGVVVVLDPRIAGMRYGRQFLESLPPARVLRAAPAEIADVTERELTRLGATLTAQSPSAAPAASPA